MIDATTQQTLYLVTESQDNDTDPEGQDCNGMNKGQPGNFHHYLHALDLTNLSGQNPEKYGGPAVIAGSVPAPKSFEPILEIQRPGLLWYNAPLNLSVPRVFAAFSMMDGTRPRPSGWIFGFDAQNLAAAPSVHATTPGSSAVGAGIWQGGGGLSSGLHANQVESLFFSTADGTFDLNAQAPNNTDAGDSFVKLTADLQTTAGYFTPADQYYRDCNGNDYDFGSGGVTLLPDGLITAHPYLAFKADKLGGIWAIDRTNPGGYTGSSCGTTCTPCAVNNNNVQTVQAGVYSNGQFYAGFFHNNPAYWNNYLYLAGAPNGAPVTFPLTQFPICNGTAGQPSCCRVPGPPVMCYSGTSSGVSFNYGATPAVSSSGSTSGTGVLWAIDDLNGYTDDKNAKPEVLHAFDAVGMNEIYNSTMCSGDVAGLGVKYSVPTVANGYVFLGTQAEVDIYGEIMNKVCN